MFCFCQLFFLKTFFLIEWSNPSALSSYVISLFHFILSIGEAFLWSFSLNSWIFLFGFCFILACLQIFSLLNSIFIYWIVSIVSLICFFMFLLSSFWHLSFNSLFIFINCYFDCFDCYDCFVQNRSIFSQGTLIGSTNFWQAGMYCLYYLDLSFYYET